MAAYRDSTSQKIYLGGSINRTTSSEAYRKSENITLGSFQTHMSSTRKYISSSFGGFLYGGNYKAISTAGVEGGNKYFYGGGIRADASLNIPFNFIDWRIIGGKLTILYEEGAFARFRNRVAEKTDYDGLGIPGYDNLNPGNISFNMSIQTGLVYKHKNFDLGGWGMFGTGNQFLTYGYGLYFSRNHLTSFIQVGSSFYGYECLEVGLVYTPHW